jgi:hypothetical protein
MVAATNYPEKSPPSPEVESIVDSGKQGGQSPGIQYETVPVDIAAEKTLLKKLDRRLIPLLFIFCKPSYPPQ